MDKYDEYFNRCCDKKYLCEFEMSKGDTQFFKGILLNYFNGNIILFNEENDTIAHIPHRSIKFLLPIKE